MTSAYCSCRSEKIHCVGGPHEEYKDIQNAVDKTIPGHKVLVFSGNYSCFVISKSGTKKKRIEIIANSDHVTVSSASWEGDSVIRISDASYVTIEGFKINGKGVHFGIAARDARAHDPMLDLIIRGNKVANTDSSGIYLSQVAHSLIEDNHASRSRKSHGIYLANGGSDYTVLKGNHCYENGKNGIHFNGDSSVGGDGMHSNLIIEANIIYNNVANGLDLDGVRDSIFRNNLIHSNGRHALRGFKGDSAEGPKGLSIYNNSFVNNLAWSIKLTQSGGKHIIFNNILLDKKGSIYTLDNDLTSEHNIVTNRFHYLPDTEKRSQALKEWQLRGMDQSSSVSKISNIFEDQNYVKIKAHSPSIDSGIQSLANLDAPAFDLFHTKRPKGNQIDIGAIEF